MPMHTATERTLRASRRAIRRSRAEPIAALRPNRKIISVKVLNNNGIGNTSWLLNGLQWILDNRTAYNIKVVNLSLGTTAVDTYTNDPVCLKVKQLAEAGIVVIAAAGNLGKNCTRPENVRPDPQPGQQPVRDHGRCEQFDRNDIACR